ncbi:MAG: nitroreductase family protein [Gammaproteobacteria bacterium]|nr:nitroreductase family protein [Gammaproteobacteria bacterium]
MSDPTQADPGLFATLYSARALRRFRPDPIPEDVLFQIMDAAIRAPSGQNAQDWRFILVRDPEHKARMQEWAQIPWQRYQARYADRPEDLDALPRSQRLSLRSVEHLVHHLAEAPAIVLVLGLKGRHSTPGGSAFPAAQNLLLAARGLGLSGSIFNLPLSREEALREMLGIPENNQIYCALPIGYPSDRHGPLGRKPVKQVVYDGAFGRKWAFAEKQPDVGWQDRWLD